jgi:hypothetical protein
MTAINKNNYEVYFLDHIEGRLDADQTAALMLFLDAHPELKEELEGLEMVSLEPNAQIRFDAKESLKKPLIIPTAKITEQNYEEYCVAEFEGDLSRDEMNELHQFLALNPDLKKEYDLIRQCHLHPDFELVFTDKSSLKKNIVVPFLTRRIYYGIAVAASLALLIGLSFLFEPGSDRPTEIARVESLPAEVLPDEIPEIYAESTTLEPSTTHGDFQIEGSLPPASRKTPSGENERMEISSPSRSREMMNLNRLASLKAPEKLEVSYQHGISADQRNYFSKYFDDIAMAQNIRHAEEMAEEFSAERLFARGAAVVREIFQPGDEEIQILPEQVDLWQIADFGINGFARITGADLEFRRKIDNDGRVIAFAFESQSMQISRNLRRNK